MASVFKIRNNLFVEMVCIDNHVGDAEMFQIFQRSIDYGSVCNGQQRFRGFQREGLQTRSQTCRKDHCFHVVPFCVKKLFGS